MSPGRVVVKWQLNWKPCRTVAFSVLEPRMQQWAGGKTAHGVEMGGKELDPLVVKRSCDERDGWIGRSACPERFRGKWEFKLPPGGGEGH